MDVVTRGVQKALTPKVNTICIAYSGGLDSTVLLHAVVACMPIGTRVHAVHVHHGLHAHADQWAAHCQAICRTLNIPFTLEHVHITPEPRHSLEDQARQARYHALSQHVAGGYLLTAHHQDDQAESVLLALKRGSGTRGLGGIRSRQTFANGQCLRPLLECSRAQLLHYAQQHHLTWIEDDSNQDTRFDRNFLRHQVFPLLHSRWPAWSACASRSAALCQQSEVVLSDFLDEQLQTLIDAQNCLDISAFMQCDPKRHTLLLRRWIARTTTDIPRYTQLQCILTDVIQSKPDAMPVVLLPKQAHTLRRFRNKLYILPHPLPKLTQYTLPLTIGHATVLPQHLGALTVRRVTQQAKLRLPQASETLSLRFHSTQPIQPVGRSKIRKLKKLWQEYNVPPWQRGRLPLLFYNDTCAAVLALDTHEDNNKLSKVRFICICQGFTCSDETQGLHLFYQNVPLHRKTTVRSII